MHRALPLRTGPQAAPVPQPQDRRSRVPCRFYAAGRCHKGQQCPYSHAGPPERAVSQQAVAEIAQSRVGRPDQRSQTSCIFFAKGMCRNGDSCSFSHAVVVGPGVKEQPEDKEEKSRGAWTRELGGAVVTFAEGASVSKVSLPSDFSAVRLNKLPRDSTAASVVELLAKLDVIIPPASVKVVPPEADHDDWSANIRVEDPLFAEALCRKLSSGALSDTDVPHIEAVPIEILIPVGSSLRRIDHRKVHCSWHKPTRTVWLNFGSDVIAQEVHRRFTAGTYKILACAVKAGEPKLAPDIRHRNPVAWTVVLTDVPGAAKEEDVRRSMPPFQRPRHIELGQLTYTEDAEWAGTVVRSMLTSIGPLEWWEIFESESKRIKAQARFIKESNAREAVASLDKKALPFAAGASLTVHQVTSAKFKISTRVYNVLVHRIEAHKSEWKTQHIRFTVFSPLRGHRVLKVEGEDSQVVAQAKSVLEAIIGGTVAKKNDVVVWTQEFKTNSAHRKNVRHLEQALGVVITRDGHKPQLRVYGPESNCEKAIEALAKLVEEDSSETCHITLSPEQFRWACRGGFDSLSRQLSGSKTTFDIVSTPKQIIVIGPQADHQTAQAMVFGQALVAATAPTASAPAGDEICSVCWTEAEEPVRTLCGHAYCTVCFADFCRDGAAKASIACVGDADRCKTPLALADLAARLSAAGLDDVLEDILEASFTAHVRRHPSLFRPCPTPDCDQIYRVTAPAGPAAAAGYRCGSCLAFTCTACHAAHPSLSCAEHRDLVSGGHEANRKLKQKLHIKDCPKCGMAIEKLEGCNHMTCSACHCHFCWKCLETFTAAGPCYTHLNEKHGGIFDPIEGLF